MVENYSLNYELFIRKLCVIGYLKTECKLSHKDIAFIVSSQPEIIRTYCISLLHFH